MITITDIKNNEKIKTYIQKADEALGALGYTDHGLYHSTKVATEAKEILQTMGYTEREADLAWIAGYLHDIGNVVNRADHAQSGAIMSFTLLSRMGMDAMETSVIISAIGNHDEATAFPVNAVAAALILADKSDVRRSRVRNTDRTTFDIHDRVNYAVERSELRLETDHGAVVLELTIDTEICPVIDYFEIFLDRMMLCRRAADFFSLKFGLVINGVKLL